METHDDGIAVDNPTPEQLPFFYAEAMSPLMRIGVLAGALFAAGLVVVNVVAMAFWPHGLFSVNEFLAVETIGLTAAQGFIMMLVYGGLLGSNRSISDSERRMWYAAFVFPGPFSMPLYWIMYVRTAPYLHQVMNRAEMPVEGEQPRASRAPSLISPI